MKSYSHFTPLERKMLHFLYGSGKGIREIALEFGRSPSTISRELKRNSSERFHHYNFWGAQIKYIERRFRCHRKNNLLHNPQMYDYVLDKLNKFWSPELIAGRWNKEHSEHFSFSSVYRAVKAGLFPNIKAKTHLRRRGKPYAKQRKSYTKYMDSSIHDRPTEANERSRLGDYEGDTIYGSVGKGYLVTIVDRTSRFLMAATCVDKSLPNINAAFEEAYENAEIVLSSKTLTLDNGSEFAGFHDIEKSLGVKVYFADSHSPWQRGSNENINGLIRYFLPRGTDFRNLSSERLRNILYLINTRPRKCLGYLSPIEFIHKCCT